MTGVLSIIYLIRTVAECVEVETPGTTKLCDVDAAKFSMLICSLSTSLLVLGYKVQRLFSPKTSAALSNRRVLNNAI